MPDYAAFLQTHREDHLAELFHLLRIPTVGTLPEHHPDLVRAANWLADRLRRAGMARAEVLPTGGAPVVYAEWLGAPGQPTALVYGHYDVQPVDPLELWETPPFEPTVRDGRLYARGATDDKGQMFMQILAVEALLQTEGRLPINVKFLIEGEEEIGSTHLSPFLREHQELLRADFCVISDSGLWKPGIPRMINGLRGLMAMEVHVKGANSDLHSGMHGGAVQNGIHAMVSLLAGLRGPDGHILVDGFYDQVLPVSAEEREQWTRLGFDEDEYRRKLGVQELFGEPQFSVLEQHWARPTLEVNGIWGGFQGHGVKTVLVSEAHAKITCRLVPNQDPHELYDLICQHLERHCPPGVTLRCVAQQHNKPVLIPLDLPVVRAGARALEQAYGRPPVYTREGGSIPIVEYMQSLLGMPSVLLGFGLDTENLHAPNEHFHLENFDTGLLALCAFWHEAAAGA